MGSSLISKPNRHRIINFRVSSTEFDELLATAAEQKVTVSELCRAAVISGTNLRTPAARLKRLEAAAEETLAVVRQLAAAASISSGGAAK